MADMNAGIILAGQPFNALGAIQQGNEAAASTNALNRQRQLQQLYAAQGAGIANGDPEALNALAGVEPMAALDVQKVRLGMDATRQGMQFDAEKMGLIREEAKRAAAQYAAGLTAQERAAEAQKIEAGLKGAAYFYANKDEAGYNQFLQQNGIDPATHPFEMFPAIASQYDGALEALKTFDTMANPKADPQSAAAKLAADFRNGLIDRGTYEAALAKLTAKDGMSLSVGPDGTVQLVQGAGVAGGDAPPKLTVDAAKNAGFYSRTLEANKVLNELENQGTDFVQSNLDRVPFGAGNYMRSKEFQKFDQARRDFVNAVLRRESGAVISDQEFENANQQYFPVPGDSPEVIAQKRKNRETTMQGLRIGSAEGATYVDQQKAGENAIPPAPTGIDGITPENWPQVWEAMPEEDRALFK